MAEPVVVGKKPAPAPDRPRFTARLRYARISARKMRYVVDLIRGKDFNSAVAILRVCSKRGAMFVKKLLESAVGNATHLSSERNLELDANRLHVVEARVDGGPIIKRWRAASVRRPNQIKKRLCHVFLALEERDLKETRRDRSKRQKQDRTKKQAAEKAAAAPAKPAAPKPEGADAGGPQSEKK